MEATAKISGTVTYVKKGMGHDSILQPNLVATGPTWL